MFSHDVTAAILVFENNETAAMLLFQIFPVGVEFFSHVKALFCPNKFAKMLATWVKTLDRNCYTWLVIHRKALLAVNSYASAFSAERWHRVRDIRSATLFAGQRREYTPKRAFETYKPRGYIIHRTSDIGHKTSDIGHRTSDIGHHKSDIRQKKSDIKYQTSDITNRTLDIGHQTSGIRNETDIRHRTSNIRHRTSDIGHHTLDIGDQQLDITHETSDIQ